MKQNPWGSRYGRKSNPAPLKGAAEEYDLVVIGSGLGGLTAANRIARSGYKVALVEQHMKLGGLATWFKRKGGHIFDVSLHGFPVGMKKTCRKYWSQAIADRIVQLEGVRFDNPQFQFETTFTKADFTEKLVDVFGVPRETVEAFFAHLAKMDFFDDSSETTGELFERFFPGRNDVHRLLMEPISYANGSNLDEPAITYGIVFSNFMSKGVYTFVGGTDGLIGLMRDELVANGVDIFTRAQVDEILVEGEPGSLPQGERPRVVGVRVEGHDLRARAVLSNAHLKTTVLKMLDPRHLTAEFRAEVEAVRPSSSSTQVYIGIKAGETVPHVGDLLFTSSRPTFDSHSLRDFHGESRTFSFYYPDGRPELVDEDGPHAGIGRYTIVASCNANHEDWAGLDPEAYEAAKQKLCDDTLTHLERYVPGIRDKVEVCEASTPLSFAFYTQHLAGASFGTKFEGLEPSMYLHERVEGLYHAGSVGIIMSGWLGAANYGVIQAAKVDEYLHATRPQTSA